MCFRNDQTEVVLILFTQVHGGSYRLFLVDMDPLSRSMRFPGLVNITENEPQRKKTYLLTYAPKEDSNQPSHLCSFRSSLSA